MSTLEVNVLVLYPHNEKTQWERHSEVENWYVSETGELVLKFRDRSIFTWSRGVWLKVQSFLEEGGVDA